MATKSVQFNKIDWKRTIDDQAESGLSALAYCNRNSITYSSFIYWRKRLKSSDTVMRVEPGFIELTASQSMPHSTSSAQWLIELDLGPDVQLRIARHA